MSFFGFRPPAMYPLGVGGWPGRPAGEYARPAMTLPWPLLWFLLDLVLPIAAGQLLARRVPGIQASLDRVTRWGIVTAMPVLSFVTFWGVELSPRLAWLPILGLVMAVVPGAVAAARARWAWSGRDALERGSYVIASMLANRGVVGGLALFILFGEKGYAWGRLVIVFGPAVVFLVGFPLAQRFRQHHEGRSHEPRALRELFLSPSQAPLVGLAAGLSLNLAGVERPGWVGTCVPGLALLVAWIFLMPTGASLDLRSAGRHRGPLAEILAIKFLLTPLAVAPVAWALGFRGELFATITLLAASPTAIFTVIVARVQGLDVSLAMGAFVATTVVYLLGVFPVALALVSVWG